MSSWRCSLLSTWWVEIEDRQTGQSLVGMHELWDAFALQTRLRNTHHCYGREKQKKGGQKGACAQMKAGEESRRRARWRSYNPVWSDTGTRLMRCSSQRMTPREPSAHQKPKMVSVQNPVQSRAACVRFCADHPTNDGDDRRRPTRPG